MADIWHGHYINKKIRFLYEGGFCTGVLRDLVIADEGVIYKIEGVEMESQRILMGTVGSGDIQIPLDEISQIALAT